MSLFGKMATDEMSSTEYMLSAAGCMKPPRFTGTFSKVLAVMVQKEETKNCEQKRECSKRGSSPMHIGLCQRAGDSINCYWERRPRLQCVYMGDLLNTLATSLPKYGVGE